MYTKFNKYFSKMWNVLCVLAFAVILFWIGTLVLVVLEGVILEGNSVSNYRFDEWVEWMMAGSAGILAIDIATKVRKLWNKFITK